VGGAAGWLSHAGKLWVINGDANPPRGYDTDVWSSIDGRVWTLATDTTPWSQRAGMMVASFDGYMFAMGGQTKGDPDTTVGFLAARGDSVVYVDGKPQAELLVPEDGPRAGSEEAYNDVWRESHLLHCDTAMPQSSLRCGAVVLC
jgi:hypothetical protein